MLVTSFLSAISAAAAIGTALGGQGSDVDGSLNKGKGYDLASEAARTARLASTTTGQPTPSLATVI